MTLSQKSDYFLLFKSSMEDKLFFKYYKLNIVNKKYSTKIPTNKKYSNICKKLVNRSK